MWSPASLRHALLTLVVVGLPLVAAIVAVGYGVRLLDDDPALGASLTAGVALLLAALGRLVWRTVGVATPHDAPDWDVFERLRLEWEKRSV